MDRAPSLPADGAPLPQAQWRGRSARWLSLGTNLGALLGVVVLIFELQQTRELTRAQIRHEMAAGIVELLQVPAADEQLADILFRAETGGSLTDVEQFRFELRTNALLRYWEDVHYQYRVGLYEPEEYDRQRDAWGESLNRGAAPMVDYWCKVQALYSAEFRREMNALLSPDACSAIAAPAAIDGLPPDPVKGNNRDV